MLIEDSIKTQLLDTFCTVANDYEALSLVAKNILIAVVYRPPDGNINNILAYFGGILRFGNDNNLSVIIGGDFNINKLLNYAPRNECEVLLPAYMDMLT